MKPSDLYPHHSKNKGFRSVLVEDRIFYAFQEEGAEALVFPEWDDPALFGNHHPRHIEYCSGNGTWIAAKAVAHPEINWVAVERKFARVRKIWSKIKNLQLSNLVVVWGEAYDATQRFFKTSSFANAYLNFPDPWPKRRHAGNRLMQPKFVDEIWRILQPEAVFSLVTDDVNYSEQMLKEMLKYSGFQSLYPAPYFTHELSGYGSSTFEKLWREKGRQIRYHQFLCKKNS